MDSGEIGLVMVKKLALRGAKVYFTTRSESNAQKAREALQTQNPEITEENLKWLLLDLMDLKSISAAADELARTESKIDILSRYKAQLLSRCPHGKALLTMF